MNCGDCGKEVGGDEFFTLINPEGGYGQPQFLCCDSCMRSGRWSYWIKEHWPNWPSLDISDILPSEAAPQTVNSTQLTKEK